jgi:hypothetical protein
MPCRIVADFCVAIIVRFVTPASSGRLKLELSTLEAGVTNRDGTFSHTNNTKSATTPAAQWHLRRPVRKFTIHFR